MADASVRPARPEDARAIAVLQVEAFGSAYGGILVAADLDIDTFAATWRASIMTPPTARHVVLLAAAGDEVVGVASLGPASDHPDLDASAAELFTLVVAPARAGAGHGSRLQQATVDTAREYGFARLVTWVGGQTDALRAFLVASGWGPDGATRELDLHGDGVVLVRQVRLRTGLDQPHT